MKEVLKFYPEQTKIECFRLEMYSRSYKIFGSNNCLRSNALEKHGIQSSTSPISVAEVFLRMPTKYFHPWLGI